MTWARNVYAIYGSEDDGGRFTAGNLSANKKFLRPGSRSIFQHQYMGSKHYREISHVPPVHRFSVTLKNASGFPLYSVKPRKVTETVTSGILVLIDIDTLPVNPIV